MKHCSGCGEPKEIDDFYLKGGRRTAQCKVCLSKKTIAWAKANPVKRKKTWRKWLRKNRQQHRQQCRASYKKHPNTSRRYAEQNRTRKREIARAWANRNLEYLNSQWHKRRARIRGNGGTHTVEEIRALFAKQAGYCANGKCHADLIFEGFHRDHITPLVRGGSNSISNIQLLCPPCNLKKGKKVAC